MCEGKFFSDLNPQDLNNQLRSQRCQVRHLFHNRPQIRAYRHVAIVPEQFDEMTAIDADVVEPISKSSEEDNEAGELDKAEEVLSVVLPADEYATLPLYPGEEALDEPAPLVTA